ncbi:sigma-54-dependent Fis family transcriptional regulator [bacterium]|nr:sigma-54-dependent Fis family transcriptional regulator [bacterium]
MITYSIYVIDDEETIREGISTVLGTEYNVKAFTNAESAFDVFKISLPDLILLDIGLPGMNGIDALRKIKEIHPEVLIIMITAYEDINSVVSAMKLGAYDYVLKPIHMDRLELSIKNALESIKLRKEIQYLQEQYIEENMPFFIGKSNIIQEVIEFIKLVAKSPDTPILILGETGTGKELIAKAIHYRSPNFKGPLITMNCASLPGELVESELFGYEKGAFTGAKASGKKGLIEEAANGTLFLDEIGDLSMAAQAKLLRFLEEGEFYRVGGTHLHTVNTRVVSATNKDIKGMIERDQFRKDLYYRIGVVTVEVPSLNERSADIVQLSNYFLERFSKKFNKQFNSISQEACEELMNHHWTGNIRELKNVIERAVLIGNGSELSVKDIGFKKTYVKKNDATKDEYVLPPISATGIDISDVQKSIEKYYLENALKIAKGNVSAAARLLKMNHHTFRYKLKLLRNNPK